jgi:uncharacterized protein YqjF (DUF2071 family)
VESSSNAPELCTGGSGSRIAETVARASTDMRSPFLTARWESLVLRNYHCPEELLLPLVPPGTELDDWGGDYLVSLVGFLFRDTRVRGCRIPWHRNFEEVNLRFYVRRETAEEIRRGVVFVRELVPRRAIATVARAVYHEPYTAVPMAHRVSLTEGEGGSANYSWRHRGAPYSMEANASGAAQALEADSEAEFITEHYWGYNRQRDGSTLEYQVAHPSWKVWMCDSSTYQCPADDSLYGSGFSEVLRADPASSHLALGSEVEVYAGVPLGTV